MYKPEFRIIHIIKSILNVTRNMDNNTKHKVVTGLNTYAIDSLKQIEEMHNKISNLEDEIKVIKDTINSKK